jgi:hypothetical protein
MYGYDEALASPFDFALGSYVSEMDDEELSEVDEEEEVETEGEGFGDLVRGGMASAAVLVALAGGERDESALTNKVFFARHPELGGRPIRPDERALAAEWTQIRDRLVRPLLARGSALPGATSPPGSVRQRLRTQQVRDAWAADAGRKDRMVVIGVFQTKTEVNRLIADAVRALARALESTGYAARRVGGYYDRTIHGTTRRSLHAYGLAVDIDAAHNPHRRGQPGPARFSPPGADQAARRADVAAGRADTSFTPEQIAAVHAIRTADGHRVFYWAGGWRTSPDAMHFQIDVTPEELARGLAESGATREAYDEAGFDEAGYDQLDEAFEPFDAIRAVFRRPTVGFEFDVHYGILEPLLPAGFTPPGPDVAVSTHTAAADGFTVKLDGPRLEINTKPFEVDDAGKVELRATSQRIGVFAKDLADACQHATPSPVPIPDTTGSARPFHHPAIAGFPIAKLPVGGRFTNCSVWASPQATLTVPLSKVGTLVERIKSSEGKGVGVALTGDDSRRMGLRSEALYRALRAVRAARRAAPFSADVEGLLILLASYVWAGELPYRFPAPDAKARPGEDYEQFGKAYLPINVKTPFNQVFGTLLSAADQQVFRTRFAAGAAREHLFRLVRPTATVADGGRTFLPPGRKIGGVETVHEMQKSGLGLGRAPTWDDLVDHTIGGGHGPRANDLMVTHSTPLDVSRTRPRVALELRRIGFAAVDRSRWDGFLQRVFALTEELNR